MGTMWTTSCVANDNNPQDKVIEVRLRGTWESGREVGGWGTRGGAAWEKRDKAGGGRGVQCCGHWMAINMSWLLCLCCSRGPVAHTPRMSHQLLLSPLAAGDAGGAAQTQCDIIPGQSGSPMYDREYYIRAVVSYSSSQVNGGIQLNTDHFNAIRGWAK
jgi:hypothetical protein